MVGRLHLFAVSARRYADKPLAGGAVGEVGRTPRGGADV